MKQLANLLLLVQMVGAVYIHTAVKDPLERMTPALTFLLLLICRYVVHLQVTWREQKEEKLRCARQVPTPEQDEEDDECELEDEGSDINEGLDTGEDLNAHASSDDNKKMN